MAIMQEKATYIKIVVTGSSNVHEFRNLTEKIFEYAEPGNLVGFVIQPSFGDNQPGLKKLLSFYDCVYPIYDEVRIVPQLHKLIGVR